MAYVLLASLLAFGRLSGTSQIIVMRAGGMSFLRLAMPVYIAAFFISIGAIAFNEYVVPAANHAYQNIIRNEIKKQAEPPAQEHIVLKTMEGDNISTLMYAKRYDSTTKLINGVTAQLFTNGEVTQIEHDYVKRFFNMLVNIFMAVVNIVNVFFNTVGSQKFFGSRQCLHLNIKHP